MKFVGVDKLSLVDFDDYLSMTFFTDGCNFRCPFCHNGELVLSKENPHLSDEEIDQLLTEKKGKIDAIVITGGEPLIHADIKPVLKHIKEYGYLIKLDTNGTNPKLLKELVNEHLIDYVAMDVKNSLSKYSFTAGVANANLEAIKESIAYLLSGAIPSEFRTTIIKEFHTIEDVIDIANTIKGCKKYVLQRYKDREQCIAHGFHEIDDKEIQAYLKEVRKIIPNVSTRGY